MAAVMKEASEWKEEDIQGENERERGESEVELSAWCEWAWEMRGTYGPSLAPMMGICLVTDAHICMETTHKMTLYWLTLIQTSDLVFFIRIIHLKWELLFVPVRGVRTLQSCGNKFMTPQH